MTSPLSPEVPASTISPAPPSPPSVATGVPGGPPSNDVVGGPLPVVGGPSPSAVGSLEPLVAGVPDEAPWLPADASPRATCVATAASLLQAQFNPMKQRVTKA